MDSMTNCFKSVCAKVKSFDIYMRYEETDDSEIRKQVATTLEIVQERDFTDSDDQFNQSKATWKHTMDLQHDLPLCILNEIVETNLMKTLLADSDDMVLADYGNVVFADSKDIVLANSRTDLSNQFLITISKEITDKESLAGNSQNRPVKYRLNDVITKCRDVPLFKLKKISVLFLLMINLSGVCGELHAKAWFKTDINCRETDSYIPFVGEPVQLICEYGLSKEQVEEINWHKNESQEVLFHYKKGITVNNIEHKHSFTQKGHTLTLKSVAMADEGLYNCTVKQGYTNSIATAYVNLQGKIKIKPVKQDLTNELYVIPPPVPVVFSEFTVSQGFNATTFTVIMILSDPELMCSPPEILLHLIYLDEELKVNPSTCAMDTVSTRCEYHILEKSLQGSGQYKIKFYSKQYGIESDRFTYKMNYAAAETVAEIGASKTNPGIMAGVIVTVVAFFVLILVTVVLAWYRKKYHSEGGTNTFVNPGEVEMLTRTNAA